MPRPAMWNQEELKKLGRLYGKHTARELSTMIGRPPEAIKHKARELGLANTGETPIRWSDAEIDRLRLLWPHHTAKDLSLRLGRKVHAIRTKALELGLNKAAQVPWTDEEVALLRELWPMHTDPEVSMRLGRSMSSVRSKAYILGLKHHPSVLCRQPTPELRHIVHLCHQIDKAIKRRKRAR